MLKVITIRTRIRRNSGGVQATKHTIKFECAEHADEIREKKDKNHTKLSKNKKLNKFCLMLLTHVKLNITGSNNGGDKF